MSVGGGTGFSKVASGGGDRYRSAPKFDSYDPSGSARRASSKTSFSTVSGDPRRSAISRGRGSSKKVAKQNRKTQQKAVGQPKKKKRRRKAGYLRGKSRQVIVLAIIAVLFLSPAAQAWLRDGINYLLGNFVPGFYREYDQEVELDLQRDVVLANTEGVEVRNFEYRAALPPVIRNTEWYLPQNDRSNSNIDLQEVKSIIIRSSPVLEGQQESNNNIVATLTGSSFTEEYSLEYSNGTVVSLPAPFPVQVSSSSQLEVTATDLIWSGDVPASSTEHLVLQYKLVTKSFMWEDLDAEVPGQIVSASNSGTFDDLVGADWRPDSVQTGAEYGRYVNVPDQGVREWNRGGTNWAINPADADVRSLANQLADPNGNVFNTVRSFYEYLDENVEYGQGQSIPRSGGRCLDDGVGDCDEQSNLFISLCRAVGIPAWLEFGALTDNKYEAWELHGWANVLMPVVSGSDVIFVEASMDIVNDKFLLYTTGAFSEWIDIEGGVGDQVNDFYNALSYSGTGAVPSWSEDLTTLHSATSGDPFRVAVDVI